jgi:hypothetical protein
MRGTTLVTGTSHREWIGGRGEGGGGFFSFASFSCINIGFLDTGLHLGYAYG